MGNRAVITLEDDEQILHPVMLYVQWNGGIESVLAFVQYTWDTFDRGRGDIYTFHARLCQVIGNFFPDGLCLYGHPVNDVDQWDCDNGRWHFRIGKESFELLNRPHEVAGAKVHDYWTNTPSIFDSIKEHMPIVATAIHYEVQTYTICDGWINCWKVDGEPQVFDCAKEAQTEIDEFFTDIAAQIKSGDREADKGYSRDDYRIVRVNTSPEGGAL